MWLCEVGVEGVVYEAVSALGVIVSVNPTPVAVVSVGQLCAFVLVTNVGWDVTDETDSLDVTGAIVCEV